MLQLGRIKKIEGIVQIHQNLAINHSLISLSAPNNQNIPNNLPHFRLSSNLSSKKALSNHLVKFLKSPLRLGKKIEGSHLNLIP